MAEWTNQEDIPQNELDKNFTKHLMITLYKNESCLYSNLYHD